MKFQKSIILALTVLSTFSAQAFTAKDYPLIYQYNGQTTNVANVEIGTGDSISASIIGVSQVSNGQECQSVIDIPGASNGCAYVASKAFAFGSSSTEISASIDNGLAFHNIGLIAGVSVTTPIDTQFVFSKSLISFTLQITDATSGLVVASKSYSGSGTSLYASWIPDAPVLSSFIANIVQTSFTPGYFAVPSDDPSCASITCMKAIAASNPSMYFGMVASVPEPSSYALLAVGIGFLFLALRRSGKKSQSNQSV